MNRIGIGWTLGLPSGGGVYALNLALQAMRRGVEPVLLSVAERVEVDALRRRVLEPSFQQYRVNREAFARNKGRSLPFPVLQPIGDRLSIYDSAADAPGRPDIGLLFFENVDIPAANLHRAAAWPLMIAGSSWNARVLRDKGLTNVVNCPQGVDPTLFHPAPRAGLFPDRFVVFSGGKLEYRKGQDIVVAAFRAFHRRHPDALLVCGWANLWPDTMREVARSPHVEGLPEVRDGALQVIPWLARNGIPAEAVIDLGLVRNSQMPGILRECDLAVFPSRCEGGTNLPAMEALACGVPTVLSGNTGHLDLMGDHVYILDDQGDVAALTGEAGREGWGESSVDQLVEIMERAHAKRAEAVQKGEAAARFMQDWSWERRVDAVLEAVRSAVGGQPVPAPTVADDYAWGFRLFKGGRMAEAERVYDDILARDPRHVGARGDRGNARRMRGDVAGAEADYRAVLAMQPDHTLALRSLGGLLRREGRVDEAAEFLIRASALSDDPKVRWDLAFTLLLHGRYEEAWPHFAHRHAALGLRTAHPSKPRWDGTPVENGTLLVLDEQGLGDTLQFLRFLPRIPVGPGGRVIFAGKPATLSLVRRVLPAADVFRWDEPLPRSQSWVPLMTLPSLQGVMRPEDVPPPACPGSAPDPERVAQWRPLVRGSDDRPVVGLCWRGNPDFPDDAIRSPGLAPLLPLLNVTGVRFVALQVGGGRREMADLGVSDRLADVGGAIEAAGSDVLDTLAALESCDFVISSCTSMVHMVGLAGRPGLVLLCRRPDWRWMLERPDTPWYPSLRLIRQKTIGEWGQVAADAAAALEAWRDGRRGAAAG